jgi:acetyl-CoA acyltransferase
MNETAGSYTPQRAVIVGGRRTPFVKAFTHFTKLDTIALGVAATRGLLRSLDLKRDEVDAIVWGGVILPSAAPNVAREIALDLRLPPTVYAHTVSQACISSIQSITTAAAMVERGDADVVVAGGSESTSNAEVKLPQKAVHALAPLAFGKPDPQQILGVLADLWPFYDLLPQRPQIAERTTGLLMGESAEQMARRNGITREAQDELAARSHHRAAAALESGRFESEIEPITPPGSTRPISRDSLVRADTSVDKLARLRPVFARGGTLTAGNSSPLTDGAAATVVMTEQRARELGLTRLTWVRDWRYVGVDPGDQLLIGPAVAIPELLARHELGLDDLAYVDLHEAFAAQVLCVLQALASEAFSRERLGHDAPLGEVDPARLNVHGGSVSIGHPFGATGARMATTMHNELHLQRASRAVLGLCAAGGLGAALLLERLEG